MINFFREFTKKNKIDLQENHILNTQKILKENYAFSSFSSNKGSEIS